jgi:APA family basic amino acid/polyamine antiporter
VKDVKVTFTTESLATVRAQHGPAVDGSLARIRQAMEDQLQYEPTTSASTKLEQVRDGNKHGYEAYDQTPAVIGSIHLTCNIVAIAIVAIISTILVLGIRESAGFNALMVLVKVAVVLFVIFAGMTHIDTSNWTPFLPYGWYGVLGGAAVIFFAYIGFDSVSTHAEEARNPKRDVPIGIISSLAVCTVLYIAVAAVVTGMIPYPQIPLNAPIAGAFQRYGSTFAPLIISIGAITGITSVLLVMLLSQPRVLLAMARDGLLPYSFFGAVHHRFRTPHKATILTGIVCALTASLFPLEGLSHMVNIGTLFAFVVVCSAVWLMRWLNPHAERPFRTPLLHFVAPAGILLCLALMIRLGWQNWLRLIVWLAAGMLIYWFYGRHHSTLGKELRGEISLHGVSPAGVPVDEPTD